MFSDECTKTTPVAYVVKLQITVTNDRQNNRGLGPHQVAMVIAQLLTSRDKTQYVAIDCRPIIVASATSISARRDTVKR